MKSISEKEWLDLAWKYFQQHAQQRISYFNFFVIFSTILTTGFVTTFQKTFGVPYLGIAIGLIQIFLSFMFWKIDQRNKFLTKHAEEIIKSFELTSETNSSALFAGEEIKTNQQVEVDKPKFFLLRQITHGKSYEIIYLFFFIWGAAGVVISSIMSKVPADTENAKIEAAVYLKYEKIDSLKNEMNRKDSITNLLFYNLKKISTEIDSLQIISKTHRRSQSK